MLVQAKAKVLYKANTDSLSKLSTRRDLLVFFLCAFYLDKLVAQDGISFLQRPLVSAAVSLFCTWQLRAGMVLCSV